MTKTLVDKLIESAEKTKSIVCFGIDPVLENMPPELKPGYRPAPRFVYFLKRIFEKINSRNIKVGAFKPNEGFYLKHDWQIQYIDKMNEKTTITETLPFDGSNALKDVLRIIDWEYSPKVPIILDIKRGDIGKSSKNYAEHAKEMYAPDAVTVNPYMGTDSIEPFLQQGAAYILCRTSNPGAKDLQDLLITRIMDDQIGEKYLPVYMIVAELIAGKWHDISPGNIGAVVGATSPNELEQIAQFFKSTGKQIPILIPGVGGQGGSAKEVAKKLRNIGYDLRLVRINSSSGITEAWKKENYKPEEFAKASVDAIQKLNEEIGQI